MWAIEASPALRWLTEGGDIILNPAIVLATLVHLIHVIYGYWLLAQNILFYPFARAVTHN